MPAPDPLLGLFRGSASPHTRQQLRARQFTRVTRDVYLRAPAEVDLRRRALAAGLVLPGSVACLTTAALLTRLPADDDGLVHVARPGDAAWSLRDDVAVHRLDVAADETLDLGGLRVTHGPRTLADLAAHLPLEDLVAVGDVVLRRYGVAAVARAVDRARGRPGVVRLRQAFALLHSGSDSPAESRARVRLHLAGFTSLVPAVVIRDELGGWLAAADLGDAVARVAVQHDGKGHFSGDEGRAAKQRRHDAERDDLSRDQGWEVVVSTARDDAEPERLIERVTRAYLRAARVRGPEVLPPHLR